MRSRQLTYFLAVVEHGGFGRAAAALRVAQPTMSQSVRALEREVGAELFRRAAHGVVLTAAGRALLGPARQLVRDVNAARRAVGGQAQLVLDLAATAPLGAHPGAELITSFGRTAPDVIVHLDRPDEDSALAAMVRDGTSEIGLGYLPLGRLGLAEIELGTHELLLASPPGSDPGPGPVPLDRLDGMRVIGPPPGGEPRDYLRTALRAAGIQPRLVVEVAQRDAALELVALGVGATIVTDAMATGAMAALIAGRVHLTSFDPPIRRPYGLVFRPGSMSDPAAAFLAHARDRARDGG